jgi:hypothetical protein
MRYETYVFKSRDKYVFIRFDKDETKFYRRAELLGEGCAETIWVEIPLIEFLWWVKRQNDAPCGS